MMVRIYICYKLYAQSRQAFLNPALPFLIIALPFFILALPFLERTNQGPNPVISVAVADTLRGVCVIPQPTGWRRGFVCLAHSRLQESAEVRSHFRRPNARTARPRS